MDNNNAKKEFHEALAAMVEFATVSGNQINRETIHQYMKDIIEDESMYHFVYQYLTEMKIQVEGYSPSISAPLVPDIAETNEAPVEVEHTPIKEITESNEALAFYEMYLDEMHSVKENINQESAKLLNQYLSGDKASAHLLVELYLPKVVDISEKFSGHGVTLSDLVAEGNLALLEGILAYPAELGKNNIMELENFLQIRIEDTLKTAIDTEVGSSRVSNHLAEQINALNDVSTEIAKEQGREATLEELCEKLALGEDEVKELMRVSINALTVTQTDED